MAQSQCQVSLNPESGAVTLAQAGQRIDLHPLWMRERVMDATSFNALNNQRLYDHNDLPLDLKVLSVDRLTADELRVKFSDGHVSDMGLTRIKQELGWDDNPDDLPVRQAWTTTLNVRPEASWPDLDDPKKLKAMLDDFLTYGFCIIQDTPTQRNSLLELAGKFGYVRDSHWGKIFNVEKKPQATDSAYTDFALSSHTDNPYREPIPGLQFLHCLANEVTGGLSTLVDGIAISQRLAEEAPEQAKVLETVSVRYRYEGPSAILENYGPIIERDHFGIVSRIRLSAKLDFVPALDMKTLELFYAGRQRLLDLSNDDEFQITFPFRKGTLLMMDNYRLLHGRTAFNGDQGHRHLQGCYTDHDGVTSLYRMLARDGKTVAVTREENL